MLKIAIIVGSTRPGRKAATVADWVLQHAQGRSDAKFAVVDLADHPLPLLDEPMPPAFGRYTHEHTKKWSSVIAGYDGFVFVTPEYNHATSGALKNAIDYLYAEWNNKAAGIVSYGSSGGVRAAENLRLILGELQIADVRTNVGFSLFTDFEDFTTFKPGPQHTGSLTALLDQLVSWSGALQSVRESATAAAA